MALNYSNRGLEWEWEMLIFMLDWTFSIGFFYLLEKRVILWCSLGIQWGLRGLLTFFRFFSLVSQLRFKVCTNPSVSEMRFTMSFLKLLESTIFPAMILGKSLMIISPTPKLFLYLHFRCNSLFMGNFELLHLNLYD